MQNFDVFCIYKWSVGETQQRSAQLSNLLLSDHHTLSTLAYLPRSRSGLRVDWSIIRLDPHVVRSRFGLRVGGSIIRLDHDMPRSRFGLRVDGSIIRLDHDLPRSRFGLRVGGTTIRLAPLADLPSMY